VVQKLYNVPLSAATAAALNKHRIFLFSYGLKLNSGNVRLEAQTLAEKQSTFKVYFIMQIDHRQEFSNSNCSDGQTGTCKKKHGRYVTTLSSHYDADATKAVLDLTKKQLLLFFTANGIVR